jgi:hypothetical protein
MDRYDGRRFYFPNQYLMTVRTDLSPCRLWLRLTTAQVPLVNVRHSNHMCEEVNVLVNIDTPLPKLYALVNAMTEFLVINKHLWDPVSLRSQGLWPLIFDHSCCAATLLRYHIHAHGPRPDECEHVANARVQLSGV